MRGRGEESKGDMIPIWHRLNAINEFVVFLLGCAGISSNNTSHMRALKRTQVPTTVPVLQPRRPPLPNLLRHPHQRIQTLQPRHLEPPLPRHPYRIPQDNLDLEPLPGLPIHRHARLAPRRVALRAPDDGVRGRKVRGHGLVQELRRGGEDLVHHAEQMHLHLGVVRHGGVGGAEGEHGRGVHGGVDGQFVPAEELQFRVRVGGGVGDAALHQRRDEGGVSVDRGGVAGFWRGGRVEVGQVGPAVDTRPAVVLDLAVGGLRAGGDGDGAEDGGAGEAGCVGAFDAEAVLD